MKKGSSNISMLKKEGNDIKFKVVPVFFIIWLFGFVVQSLIICLISVVIQRRFHLVEKANVLNQPYESVFSDIDFNQYIDIRYYTDKEFRLPKLPKPTGKYMKPINVTKPCIIKQLKNINPSKATGSDLIPCVGSLQSPFYPLFWIWE
jgi:hypothetical protein